MSQTQLYNLKRVVVTGMGMVSPLGSCVNSSWKALLKGETGIINIKDLENFKNDENYPECYISPCHSSFDHSKWKIPFTSNATNSYVMAATTEALNDANWHPQSENDQQRSGVIIGVMNSNINKVSEIICQASQKGFNSLNRLTMLHVLSNMPSANVSIKFNLKGPSGTTSSACATGSSAIGEAYRNIQLGEVFQLLNLKCDVMVAGGGEDVVNPVCIHSSIKMQAMSTKKYQHPSQSSRPFDEGRSGFILGEGSGILVLEELEHAISRGAKIYAEIIGFGCTSDAYHLTKPHPTGEGGLRAMNRAIQQASINFKQIDHINCHATSTPVGDQAEAQAIANFLNNDEECIYKVSIAANKSQLGHCFGAAGSIESIFTILSLKNDISTGIMNLDDPLKSELQFIKSSQKKQSINYAIKNSFGFGGINTALLFKKYLI